MHVACVVYATGLNSEKVIVKSEKVEILGNEKYKIRAQSPQKMRRTYIKDGKNITFEDYFYKISEKDQWVFGYFTNRRLSNQ